MKRLRNVVSGIEGIFVRITHPTGKPQTTVIQTDKGLYFAPTHEFIEI